MRAIQIDEPGGEMTVRDVRTPEPGRGEVRVAVQACGVCHSDMFTKEGAMPGISYPATPGHEVVGVVDALGDGVTGWTVGTRVGVGWFGGVCWVCDSCRRGDFITCANLRVPGMAYPGGYAEAMVAPTEALVAMPEELSAAQAAPLLCAGVTTYNGLRRTGALPGQRVAVLGVGGLGHLGIQYAAKMGFQVIAISRGPDKRELALRLGAAEHIDSSATDPGPALAGMGGAAVVLATAASGKAISAMQAGLAPRGQLVVLGASEEPIELAVPPMLMGAQQVHGHPSGTAKDSEDTLEFSRLTGVQAMIETAPLEQAASAYQKMMSGEARFRMVLTTGN